MTRKVLRQELDTDLKKSHDAAVPVTDAGVLRDAERGSTESSRASQVVQSIISCLFFKLMFLNAVNCY